MVERGKRCLDRPLLRTTDLPAALGEMLDSSAGSDTEGNEAVAEDLHQVIAK